jgi:hypothetical protein
MSPSAPLARPASLLAGIGLAALVAAGCNGGGSGSGSLLVPSGGTSGGGTSGGNHPHVSQPFRTIVRGESSIIATESAAIATTAPQWDLLWQSHAGPSAPPAVGFPLEAAVGVFAGPARGPEALYEVVRIDRDTVTGDLRATARLFEKGAWRAATTAAAPYHLVATPAPAGAARPAVRVEKELRLDFETLDSGAHSAIGAADPQYRGELLLIEDAPALASFWALHEPGARPPQVDFSSEMVVAVLAGFIPRFGNTVETRRIVCDPAAQELRVDHVVHPYRGGARPPQVDETPFQILRVARAPARLVRAELRAPLPVSSTASSDQSLYTGTLDLRVARDQASFDALVAARLGAGGYTGKTPDFSREQAIFAFSGQRTSGGHMITVARAEVLEKGELEVLVHTQMPFGPATTVMTSPFEIAVIPLTHGPVAFRVDDITPRP